MNESITDFTFNVTNEIDELIDNAPFDTFGTVTALIIGLAGQVGSLFAIVVILSSKPLRTSCFKLIAGGAVGSFFVALHFFGTGVDKIGQLTGTFDMERTGLHCLLSEGVFAIFGIPFHAMIACLVGVDRMISLLAPIRYRNFGNRYVIYMLSTCGLLVFIQEAIGFLTSPLYTTVTCDGFPAALHPIFLSAFAGLNLFYCTANVVVYVSMLLCFRTKRIKYKKGSSDYNTFMKQQSAAMPTVKLMTILYFLCGILPEILINIALRYDVSNAWVRNQLIAGDFLKTCSSLVEVVSLIISCKKFRDRAKLLSRWKLSYVNAL